MIRHKHNLITHILSQHSGSTPEVHWHCPICREKTFKSAASLRDHISRKHKCRGAPRGLVVSPRAITALPSGPAHGSDQDWSIEVIPLDLSETGKTEVILGSLARSQGPKTVPFGATFVAEFQVEGTSSAEEGERGRQHVWPHSLANREATRDAGLAGRSNRQRAGEAACLPRQIATAPRTDHKRTANRDTRLARHAARGTTEENRQGTAEEQEERTTCVRCFWADLLRGF